jgi:hypothetical protein
LKFKTYFVSCIMIFFMVGILFNILAFITYPLEVDNCQEILKHNSLATHDDTIRCIKIINKPIYSYYILNIIRGWILSGMIVGSFGLIFGIVYEETEGFDTSNDFFRDEYERYY